MTHLQVGDDPMRGCLAVEDPRAKPEAAETIAIAGMTLDLARYALIDTRGEEIRLTRGEFAVLTALARRPGQVLSRDRLLDAVSGRDADVFDRSIDNLVSRLRQKMERDTQRPKLILTVRGVGYKLVAPGTQAARTATSRPRVLVVSFADLGGNSTLTRSATVISMSLTAALQQVVGIELVCHRGESTELRALGQQHGARYVVCGTMRTNADDIRADACMIDVATGVPIWVDHCDAGPGDLFAFETEVAARFSRGLELELVERISRGSPDPGRCGNVEDLVTSGYAALNRPRSMENLAAARVLFDQALTIDDRHAVAVAGLAQAHVSDVLCRWSPDPGKQLHLADVASTRAIELSPRLAAAYHARGLILKVQHRYERAIAAFDMAVQLNPSLAPAHAELGFCKRHAGDDEDFALALGGLALARRLSPRDPVLANWLYGVGVGLLRIGETAPAIRLLSESVGLNPLPPALAYLAAAHAWNGDEGQSRHALHEFRRLRPHETLRTFGKRLLADHQVIPGSRLFEGLRMAGLPE
jgi:TolB-like protein